ncbi:MAG: cytochrome c3 family protein [Polyangiaceae bacterium]|nr:cytochrome c3 family protein [Polyangiaceae bacterium]
MRPKHGWLTAVVTLTLGGGVLVASLGGCAGCEPTNQYYEPTQPIPFSHALHAGATKIQCQYCHYGAEQSRHAGIPAPSVCMNCHTEVRTDSPEVAKIRQAVETNKPIEWVRVHRVPDHVYFSHEPHVTAAVPCERCHGPVAEMTVVSQWASLTMGFCLDCHRTAPAEFLGDTTSTPLQMRGGALTDCAVCHH